jgi:hypothetical protein
MKNNVANEKGLGLGISIIVALIIFMLLPFFFGFELGPAKKGPAAIFTGIYLQFWGILFLLSYFFTHKTFFFRGLMWICENFSSPRGRKMAFFYFALSFMLGSMALIQGIGLFLDDVPVQKSDSLPLGVGSIEHSWYKDPMLYIVLFVIIGLVYFRYKAKKD